MYEFPKNSSGLVNGSRLEAVGAGPIEQLGLPQGTVLTIFWNCSSVCSRNPRDASDTFVWSIEQLEREIAETNWWKVLPATWYSRLVASFQAWVASF